MKTPNTPNNERQIGVKSRITNLLPGLALLAALGSAAVPNDTLAFERPTSKPLVNDNKSSTPATPQTTKIDPPRGGGNGGGTKTPKITGLSEDQVKAIFEELKKQEEEKGSLTSGEVASGLSTLALLAILIAFFTTRGKVKEVTEKFNQLEERIGEDEEYLEGEVDKAKNRALEAENAMQEITDILEQENS